MYFHLILFACILCTNHISCLSQYSLINIQQTQSSITGDLVSQSPSILNVEQYAFPQMQNINNLHFISNLSLTLKAETPSILHLTITDNTNANRWNPSASLLSPKYLYDTKNSSPQTASLAEYGLTELHNESFSFSLVNPNNKSQLIYTFSNETFLFTDTFILFKSLLTSDDIYGFGERGHNFKLNHGVYTIWPNDTGGIQQDKGYGGKNGYGHQPIGLHKPACPGVFLGFIFVNTNMQDVVISPSKGSLTSLEHRTIGGVIDYYIIKGATPDDVLRTIQYVIGVPTLPPFWSLGFHHSRYGYHNIRQVEEVYSNYIQHEIPIDTMWVDIDTLDKFTIFTLNKAAFSTLPSFVRNTLHRDHAHFIPIVDLGISYESKNEFITIGNSLNVFIKSNYTKDTLISKVWPGKTVFPDFYNPNTTLLWHYGLKKYDALLNFDGLWLDMNEPAMLDTASRCIGEVVLNTRIKCNNDTGNNYYYYKTLPYLPGYNRYKGSTVSAGSLNENALVYGKDQLISAAFNTKPMISYLMNKVSYEYLTKVKKVRPFILTRSNVIGIGKYAFHWLGDNFSRYTSLSNSISGIFSFNIFGIPMTGDDICGFFENAMDDLCARWFNLGAFYPFARNHNFIHSNDHEPWVFHRYTLPSAKRAITLRYSILRYMYSQLFLISLNEKGSYFKPVLFEYPDDERSYVDIDKKVMLGDAFILFPILTSSTRSVYMDFPYEHWNAFPNGKAFLSTGVNGTNAFSRVELPGQFENINLFLKGGSVVTVYDVFSQYVQNTFGLLHKAIDIMINPNEADEAKGVVVYDNDEMDVIKDKKYIRVEFAFQRNLTLVIRKEMNNMKEGEYKYKDLFVRKISVLRYSQIKRKINQHKVIFVTEEEGHKEGTGILNGENDSFEIDVHNVFSKEMKITQISSMQLL